MLARMWKTWNTYTLLIGLQSGAATLKNCFSEVTIWPSNSIVVQSLSCVQLFATPWTAARQVSLSITSSGSLLKLMPIESVMPSNHLILCCPLPPLPLIFPSIKVFSKQSVLRIRCPKYWSFSFSISASNEYSGLIVPLCSTISQGLLKFISIESVMLPNHLILCCPLLLPSQGVFKIK